MLRLGIISLEHPHSRGNHIPALNYMRDRVEVAAIYDEDAAFAKDWVELFGAKYYSSRDELLADPSIDAVLITSTNDHHAQDCIAAASAGKAIFCDKPIAIRPEDGVRIVEAVKKYQVPFMTTFPVRFNEAVLRTKHMIEEGKFGKILAICATNHGCMYEPGVPGWVLDPKKNGGGCIIDHTVHVADIIRWFTGAEFETVNVRAKHALHDNMSSEDIAVMHGKMSDGGIFQIDASWSRRPENPMWGDVTLRIVGERGAAFLDIYNNQRMEVYTGADVELHYPNLVAKEHGDIFDDYINHVEKGTERIGADEVDGLRTIELAYAAYDALAAGTEINVKKHFL